MTFTRRGLLALCPLTMVHLPALGQGSSDKGKRIVMDSLSALGGEKFLAMKDRIETGRAYSFYNENLSGLAIAKIYTRYLDRPAVGELGLRERQVFGKKEEEAVVFFPNGEAYEVTFRGARPFTEERMARYRESTPRNFLYILRERLKEPGLTFDFQRSDVWGNMPVDIVDVNDSENRITTVYFHQSTKLPIRQVFMRRDLKTRERDEEVTLFSKFRDVGGGVQWPFDTHRERNGEKLFQMFADTVTINRDLPDKYFELPDGIKKLKPVAAAPSPDRSSRRSAT